jgi:hypothetical protein
MASGEREKRRYARCNSPALVGEGREGVMIARLAIAFRLVLDTVSRGL